jgi:hypothetical protein
MVFSSVTTEHSHVEIIVLNMKPPRPPLHTRVSANVQYPHSRQYMTSCTDPDVIGMAEMSVSRPQSSPPKP